MSLTAAAGTPFLFGLFGGQSQPAPDAAPDPKPVTKQKDKQALSQVDRHLKAGGDRLHAEMKATIDALHTQAAQEKSLHSLLVDQQVKQQELLLSQQYNQQLMLLTQAAQRQGAELEQQATNLMLDYQQRKVEEDFVASQAGVQKQFGDMQLKFADELAKSSVYPAPPIQPPVLGQLPANLAPPMLPANLAPPLLPAMNGVQQGPSPAFRPYMPPSVGTAPGFIATAQAPSFKPSSGSFGPQLRVQQPMQGSFGPGQLQTVVAPSPFPSYVPGQMSVAAPSGPPQAGRPASNFMVRQ